MAKATVVNKVTGISIAKLDRVAMNKAALAAGVPSMPGMSDEALSSSLQAKYLQGVKGDPKDLAHCDECNGHSPHELDGCPFCGAKDENEAAFDPPGLKLVKDETDTADLAKSLAQEEKKPSKSLVEASNHHLPAMAKFTERDLDKAVQAAQSEKVSTAKHYWTLGQKISHIYDNQLWKLRSEDGKPRYKTIESFFNTELMMSPVQAYAAIDMSKAFTLPQVEEFGKRKCVLMLQAPADARAQLQKMVEEGTSSRALEKTVRQLNKGRSEVTCRNGVVQPMKAPRKPSGKTITVANILGSQTLTMYSKATLDGPKKEMVKATKLKEEPSCSVDLENDVYQVFTVVPQVDGTIKLKIETKRREEE